QPRTASEGSDLQRDDACVGRDIPVREAGEQIVGTQVHGGGFLSAGTQPRVAGAARERQTVNRDRVTLVELGVHTSKYRGALFDDVRSAALCDFRHGNAFVVVFGRGEIVKAAAGCRTAGVHARENPFEPAESRRRETRTW